MEPVSFVADKFEGFGKWSQDFFDGLIHRRRDTSGRRNPIEILKRLQREAFSDLMKLRDRQDKVERILSLYKTAKGSPFQEVGTVVRGEFDILGALVMRHNVEHDDCDVLSRAGIRTGVDLRFSFETTVRENDNLVVEFVSGQKNKGNMVEEGLGSSLSLAKVFYTASAGDWLSTFVIPMGGKCSDVAIVTNPSHQGKGLTGISSSGPPLLNLHNGSAIGLMVKKSNVVASLAQFVSGLGIPPDSHSIEHCFSTFGQVLCQLPRGTKLSLLGLLQVPKLSRQPADRGPLTLSFGGYKHQEAPERMVEEFVLPMGLSSQCKVSIGSFALMIESKMDEFTKIGGWIEMKNSDLNYLNWAVSLSDDSEDSFGWGMRFSGTSEGPKNFDRFQVESYVKLNLGKRFSIKPGVAYIKDGNSRATALMLRSNCSL
ncbi:hypothetical protein L484_016021 [Morus notabilis]|uniref:Uncharacterized protein n=1 Tax=Morus notabilis TaxID=981085 RepID=W9QZ86_9ROSA|nr:uncharacterized protein LOC21399093 [Morus notabilis]EXB60667.1 hypothetical protein L484_016021 [Morus notabilis]